ncbi:MAG: hypothetical protein OEM94_04290 [Acidimicrobiia bacterium]|nr:hypothetical protein [Acidimicrobiia bacterium]
MRRLPLFVASVVLLMVAGALPAGAAPQTLPLQAVCGGDPLIVDIIVADGSIVGFERESGGPAVFHGVSGAFVVTVTINGDSFDDARFEEDFLKGKGKGLGRKLIECEADPAFPIEDFAFTIGADGVTSTDILAYFAELGIDEDPPVFDDGDVVRFVSTFEGTARVQFPGR